MKKEANCRTGCLYFVKMAEGTKSLYLSAAQYSSANFVTLTNQKLVEDCQIT